LWVPVDLLFKGQLHGNDLVVSAAAVVVINHILILPLD
jgi:hypothetical protein